MPDVQSDVLVWWIFGQVEAWLWQLCLCFLVWVDTSATACSPAHSLTHALTLLCFPSSFIPLSVTTAPPPSLPLLVYCFLTQPPFFISCFFLLHCLPSLLFSSACSRVMVCCGLPTQRNNISGVGKVQPHMSCAAEGRLCEVRPIPHGSYSSQPRDQRPAIPLQTSSYSSSSLTIMNQMKMFTSWVSSL